MGADADKLKQEATIDVVRPKQTIASGLDDDRMGKLAKSNSDVDCRGDAAEIKKATKKVEHSFHWFSDAARDKLDALKTHLKKEDTPSWSEKLATSLLEGALTAGAGAAGKFLASKALGTASDAVKSTVGTLFGKGIDAGVKAGRAKFADASNADTIDKFIDGQKQGVRTRQQASQDEFIDRGEDQVQSVEHARELAEACSKENVEGAADKQYQASRDAWVSYLAQGKFGAMSSKEGPFTAHEPQPPWLDLGTTTTNMSNDEQREFQRRRWSSDSAPKNGPDVNDAMTGDAPGVLEVIANLPAIENVNQLDYDHLPGTTTRFEMRGTPDVRIAFLNGVNDVIRQQYAASRLSELNIPRQIVAKVAGAPDFTLNLDEQGKVAFKPRSIKWLAARAKVEKPERAKYDDDQNETRGIELLLQDLVARDIKKKMY